MQNGKIEDLLKLLSEQKKVIHERITQLQDIEDNIEWYIDYYQYLGKNTYPEIPFKLKLEKRYILAAPLFPGESMYGTAGYRLTKEKSKEEFKNTKFLRQNGYILDFHKLLDCKIQPKFYFIYLQEKPDFDHPFIQEVPAGEYLCFRGNILLDSYNPTYVKKFFAKDCQDHFVIANEYEDNFYDFQNCIYEIQILL